MGELIKREIARIFLDLTYISRTLRKLNGTEYHSICAISGLNHQKRCDYYFRYAFCK